VTFVLCPSELSLYIFSIFGEKIAHYLKGADEILMPFYMLMCLGPMKVPYTTLILNPRALKWMQHVQKAGLGAKVGWGTD